MSQKKNIKKAFFLTSAALGFLHIYNRSEFETAVENSLHNKEDYLIYNWRCGDISYKKIGSGSPLLLIHDLSPEASSYEWNKIISLLAEKHTVYAIDLLGCGNSDKNNITYTNYMFASLISDFIKKVIKEPADVIVTGNSSPLVISATNIDSALFNRIILINPPKTSNYLPISHSKARLLRNIINLPIIGTFIYNLCFSQESIADKYSRYTSDSEYINASYEAAHLKGPSSRFLFASISGNMTASNITKALSSMKNECFIVYSITESNIISTLKEYVQINPSIKTFKINSRSHTPHLDNPEKFVELIKSKILVK